MSALDDINTAREAAIAALKIRDFSECRLQAAIATAAIAMIPSGSQIAGVSSVSWSVKAIETFLKAVKTVEDSISADAAGCGPVFCEIEYTGTRNGGCEC